MTNESSNASSVTTEWTSSASASPSTGDQWQSFNTGSSLPTTYTSKANEQMKSAATLDQGGMSSTATLTAATEATTEATTKVTTELSTSTIGTVATTGETRAPISHGGLQLDQNAIIAGVLVGALLVVIILVGVCLARARQRRGNRTVQLAKTPRPTPAGVTAVIAREPNPYTNACFDVAKEEMGERMHQSEEPAIIAPGSINSVRNKEENWIIPLEELAEDDKTANFDTTRF